MSELFKILPGLAVSNPVNWEPILTEGLIDWKELSEKETRGNK